MPESSLLEKLVLIIFGWLLGLLAPIITDGIKRRRENGMGRTALLAELREVAQLVEDVAAEMTAHMAKALLQLTSQATKCQNV